MQDKVINVGNKEIHFRSTGSTPRIYRMAFKRDLFSDMQKLSFNPETNELSVESMEIFENIAYTMAKHGAMYDGKEKSFPNNVTEWLDEFDMLEFYNILPEILSLWQDNIETKSESKKK